MILHPPGYKRTDTLFPYTTLFRSSYNKLLQKEVVTLQHGKGRWNLRIEYPEWGRYLIRVKDLESGHISGKTVYIDWPGWNQRLQEENPAEAAMLSFTANKEAFRVGEEVVLTIPSSEGGRCLVRAEERRVGKEGVSTGRYRWSPY